MAEKKVMILHWSGNYPKFLPVLKPYFEPSGLKTRKHIDRQWFIDLT
jgi:hypothetical protein